MEFELTHRPSYAHLIVELAAGETVQAEPGAMVSHDPPVSIATTSSGDGLLDSARSMLGGESAFVNEFTAEGEPGRLTLAPPTPGDVRHHELAGETLYAVDGAFLASETGIDISAEFGGLKSMLAGASVTPLALSGTGSVFLEAFGGVETVELDRGESYVVDNEHVVAWEEDVSFDARRVGGLKSTFLSGEGLVMEFSGPGTVWYQTRGLDTFAENIFERIPGTGNDDDADFSFNV
jgi:uncharacterized protein (TIGR00266 family)